MSSRMRPARGETCREEELRQTIGIARCSCRGLHDRADIRVPNDDSLCTKKKNIKVHAAGKLTKSDDSALLLLTVQDTMTKPQKRAMHKKIDEHVASTVRSESSS